ncbi:hypothetical protein L6452_03690 [Arctium lappa]|uniref:Uncharacterized protein n=1 Tax=Arctium lappa TaxID=4217 RepID=A0ACB9FN08_ARCLA|nr:hypothetical protein L6452_03690 [Arctium lappa]
MLLNKFSTASSKLVLLEEINTAEHEFDPNKWYQIQYSQKPTFKITSSCLKIKSFQANELQHSYDTNYWKWEKDQYELKLKQKEEDNEKIKSEFEKAKLDIEKFSNASKAMDSLLQTQIHDKLRRGIGYNTTPPPYNNNYIPPISDLLETKNRKELSDEATKVDPLDKVVVETDSEEENSNDKSKENTVSGEIPLENHIITNEGCGKTWFKSKDIKKTEGKSGKVHYKQTTVVNPVPCKQCTCNKSEPQKHDKPRGNKRNWNNQWAQKQGIDLCKINRPKPCFIWGKLNHLAKYCYFNPINQRVTFQRQPQNSSGYRNQRRNQMAEKRAPKKFHAQNKFANIKKNTPNKQRSNLMTKKANNFVQVWVPIVKKPVSTAIPDSTANRNSAANSVSTANQVSTANKASAASSSNAAKPIILTKYSSHENPKQLIQTKLTDYIDEKGQPKTTLAWIVVALGTQQVTWTTFKFLKRFDGGHVAFDSEGTNNKCSGHGLKDKLRLEDFIEHDTTNLSQRDCNAKEAETSRWFHQIVDFLRSSHIAHALTVSPTIYIEHQRQFWANATIVTEDGVQMIKTRVCEKPLTVTEEVIRICLRLDDAAGITSIPNGELFSTLTRMGYGGPLGVFKFSKAKFSPQWRFFVHTLMHCISKKTTGWSEFSSTIAYVLVCLATARKYNFSQMFFNDLVSNLGSKKSFYMYPRFVQEVITHELTDIPHFDGVYVPKIPKGKVFSNMKKSPLDSEGVDTPLFSTMMVVSHTEEGMAAGSRTSLDHPTASQSQPSHSISIPQSLLHKPTSPITQTYTRKQVKKAPFLLVPSPTKPLSPLRENSALENIHRETIGASPNPKEVLTEVEVEHMGAKAATTPASIEEVSGNIHKTFPMATLGEQSSKGPRCQETKGVDSAFARQKTSTTKRSNDPSKEGNTYGEGEDRYNYYELMETMGNINMDVFKQGKDIEELKLIVLSQQEQIINLKQMVRKLILQRKKKQFVLRRRKPVTDAPKKGESEADAKAKGEQEEKHDVEGENEQAAETEPAAETINTASSSKEASEMVNTADLKEAAETVKEVLTELEIAETLIKAKHDTPKVTSKAKGVVIKERVDATKNFST